MYKVSEFAEKAGVTVRTLHHQREKQNHKRHEGSRRPQNVMTTHLRVSLCPLWLKQNAYARFSAFLNDPRSFWIFSCSRVMA